MLVMYLRKNYQCVLMYENTEYWPIIIGIRDGGCRVKESIISFNDGLSAENLVVEGWCHSQLIQIPVSLKTSFHVWYNPTNTNLHIHAHFALKIFHGYYVTFLWLLHLKSKTHTIAIRICILHKIYACKIMLLPYAEILTRSHWQRYSMINLHRCDKLHLLRKPMLLSLDQRS